MKELPAQVGPTILKRDLVGELKTINELGQKASDLCDELSADPEPEPPGYKQRIVAIGVFGTMILVGLLLPMSLRDIWIGIAGDSLLLVVMLLVLLWQLNGDPRRNLALYLLRQRVRKLDREHFILLTTELAKRPDGQFAVFVCHMLAYFNFVSPRAMDWPSENSTLPIDLCWWSPPPKISVEDTLWEILRASFLTAVPEEQKWGVLARVRHEAREALKRIDRQPSDMAPSQAQLRRVADLLQRAAQAQAGPTVGIGNLVRKYVIAHSDGVNDR